MKYRDAQWKQQQAREELLLRFLKAYDERNLELLGAILQQAEDDSELDSLIWKVFPEYLREEGFSDEKIEHIQVSPQDLYSLDQNQTDRAEPVITIADVAARMQVELILQRGRYKTQPTIQSALNILVHLQDPLPDVIDLSMLQNILQQYRVYVPLSFYASFCNATKFVRERRNLK